ncbi:MAG: hypothetical protein Q4G51_14985 [Dermatophilus congolensis]|nr:hypothetical protein [Dermatophilus congolensis]
MASLLIIRRKRPDRSVTYAAIAIAIAMTLNVDAVYESVDPLLGGANIATLIADAVLMIGLFFLGRAVMHTGEHRPRVVSAALSLPILLLSLAAIIAAFMFIDLGQTTARFMVDLGAQPATAIYSIINFTYCGIVIATMLVLAARQYRNSSGIQRLPAVLLTIGSAFGVLLCLAVIVMDITHTTGHRRAPRCPAHLFALVSAHLPIPVRRLHGTTRDPARPPLCAPSPHGGALRRDRAALGTSHPRTAGPEPRRTTRGQRRARSTSPSQDRRNPRRHH